MFDRFSSKPERVLFDNSSTLQLSELLKCQERLLSRAMSTAEMTLYEIRSEQISELIQQLSSQPNHAPQLAGY
jgi:hypothetical protein